MDAQDANTDREVEGFSIVVIGAMNPPLHHPSWYQFNGALSEAESAEALGKEFIFVPQVSQFAAAEMSFLCDSKRWQISSTRPELTSRALDIAKLVFDDKLVETPVSMIGLNFNTHTKAGVGDVAAILAKMACQLPFGFVLHDEAAAKVTFYQPDTIGHGELIDKARLRWEIEPSSQGKDLVYVSSNLELTVGSSKELDAPAKFSVDDLLRARMASLRERTRKQIEVTITALKQAKGG